MKKTFFAVSTIAALAVTSFCSANQGLMSCPGCKPLFAAAPASTNVKANNFIVIDTKEMMALIKSGKNIVILDARPSSFDDGTRIPGAITLSDQATAKQIADVIPTKDTIVITYCGSKQCPASQWLADHLAALGYTNVKQYAEGIEGWLKAGNKVDKTK